MLLNNKRETVKARTGEEWFCPMCGDHLVPKECTKTISHWAHFPKVHQPGTPEAVERCPHFESRWHLKMKLAYLARQAEGWEIEVPVVMEGVKYLVDVVNRRTGQVREFVHTLSKYHWMKHTLLWQGKGDAPLGIPVSGIQWVYDGEMFVRRRARQIPAIGDRPRWRSLLKPKSSRLHSHTHGIVDHQGWLLVPLQRPEEVRFLRDIRWLGAASGDVPVDVMECWQAAAKIDFETPAVNAPEIQDRVERRALQEMARNYL